MKKKLDANVVPTKEVKKEGQTAAGGVDKDSWKKFFEKRTIVTAALAALERHVQAGDVVLIKASRGIELDLLVEDLGERLEARAT